MQEGLFHWIDLPVLENGIRRPMTGNVQLQNRVAAGFGSQNLLKRLWIDSNRKVISLAAVNDCRHESGPAQAARRILTTIGAAFRTHYYLSHKFP
jgi:hypothetical protein